MQAASVQYLAYRWLARRKNHADNDEDDSSEASPFECNESNSQARERGEYKVAVETKREQLSASKTPPADHRGVP